MKFQIWRTNKDKQDGKEPFTFTIRKPKFEEVKAAMHQVEVQGKVAAGEQLLNSLWQDGDQEVKSDSEPDLKLTACLDVYLHAFQGAISEVEGESNDTGNS